METKWTEKARVYTLLSRAFAFPTETLGEDLSCGTYLEDLVDCVRKNNLTVSEVLLTELSQYLDMESADITHSLKVEHTRLFIGGKKRIVSPYGETFFARGQKREPLMFIGEEAVAVERFMKECCIGHPEGQREPLDHISLELEFLKALCLIESGLLEKPQECIVPIGAYEKFYREHFIAFAHFVAAEIQDNTASAFFSVAAGVVLSLPSHPL